MGVRADHWANSDDHYWTITIIIMNIGTMDFKGLVYTIMTDILEPLTLIILALAVVFFLWNIAQVIRKSDQPEELQKFKAKAVWGVVGIAVMVSLWGLVRILVNTFVPGAGIPLFNQGYGNSLFQINIGGGQSSGASGANAPAPVAAPLSGAGQGTNWNLPDTGTSPVLPVGNPSAMQGL